MTDLPTGAEIGALLERILKVDTAVHRLMVKSHGFFAHMQPHGDWQPFTYHAGFATSYRGVSEWRGSMWQFRYEALNVRKPHPNPKRTGSVARFVGLFVEVTFTHGTTVMAYNMILPDRARWDWSLLQYHGGTDVEAAEAAGETKAIKDWLVLNKLSV